MNTHEKNIDKAPLSQKEIDDLKKIMVLKHSSQLNDRKFEISFNLEKNKLFLKCILKNDDLSYYYPVESFIDLSENHISAKEALLLLLDYTDFYFSEFFANNEDTLIPIDWTKYTFESYDIFLRGQIRNLLQENLADEILKSK